MIAYLLIIAVAFTVVAVSLVRLVGDYLFNQQMKDDQRVAQNIAAALADDFCARDAQAVYRAAVSYVEGEAARILVLDRQGVVQVDTDSSLNGAKFENPEAQAVLGGEELAGNIYRDRGGAPKWLDRLNLMRAGNMMTGVYAAAIHLKIRTAKIAIFNYNIRRKDCICKICLLSSSLFA